MSKNPVNRPWKSSSVSFIGHDGVRLSGTLQTSDPTQGEAVLLAHCFTCSKDYRILFHLAKALSLHGYHSLRFDFAGLGQSAGDFSKTTLSTSVEDTLAAASWIKTKGLDLKAIVGHSFGGAVAILAAVEIDHPVSVICMGTSADLGRLERLLGQDISDSRSSRSQFRLMIGGKTYTLAAEFVRDLRQYSLVDTISEWERPLMVISAGEDRTVPRESCEQLFLAASPPKAYVDIPGSDHLFTKRPEHAGHIAALISNWIRLNGVTE